MTSELELSAALRSLRQLGKTESGRSLIIEFCRGIERSNVFPRECNVRETITGPILDAALGGVTNLCKQLNNGLQFHFHYHSKIARDLLLGEAHPDHIFEPQTTKLLVHLSRKAKHVLIGGAYAGDQVLLAAKAMEYTPGICHAFEPDALQFELLMQNAQVNCLRNVALNQNGLWDSDGARLTLCGDDALAFSAEAPASLPEEAVFHATTIDAYGRTREID